MAGVITAFISDRAFASIVARILDVYTTSGVGVVGVTTVTSSGKVLLEDRSGVPTGDGGTAV
jgi:hypothetical protein